MNLKRLYLLALQQLLKRSLFQVENSVKNWKKVQ